MHLVDTSRLPALRRFWLTGLAAAMLVGSTLAIAAQPDSASQKHDKAAGHEPKGSDHTGTSEKNDKSAGHDEKGADHADTKDKHDKAEGHSKKGSGGLNILKDLQKAAKSQGGSQNTP